MLLLLYAGQINTINVESHTSSQALGDLKDLSLGREAAPLYLAKPSSRSLNSLSITASTGSKSASKSASKAASKLAAKASSASTIADADADATADAHAYSNVGLPPLPRGALAAHGAVAQSNDEELDSVQLALSGSRQVETFTYVAETVDSGSAAVRAYCCAM